MNQKGNFCSFVWYVIHPLLNLLFETDEGKYTKWLTLLVSIFLISEVLNKVTKEISKHRTRKIRKVNRKIVNNYFDEVRELIMQSDITDKPERSYSVDLKGYKMLAI